jgi:hypothetical protein
MEGETPRHGHRADRTRAWELASWLGGLLALGGLCAGCLGTMPGVTEGADSSIVDSGTEQGDAQDGGPVLDADEDEPRAADAQVDADPEGPSGRPAATIESVSADPPEVVTGSYVTVTITVTVTDTVPLQDGVINVLATTPGGEEHAASIEGVSALPGSSMSIAHQSEPLVDEGVWRFRASLAASDGSVLYSGPAEGVPVTVQPAQPDIATVVDQVGHAAEGKGYCGCSTRGCIEDGCGDCWAMSYFIFDLLCAGGVSARIVQYPTDYSANHRSVLYFDGSSWVDFPYRSYDIAWEFRNTSASSSGSVLESC